MRIPITAWPNEAAPACSRFAMNRFPLLPLEEEGRSNDMPLRESLIKLGKESAPGGLVKFQPAHKVWFWM